MALADDVRRNLDLDTALDATVDYFAVTADSGGAS